MVLPHQYANQEERFARAAAAAEQAEVEEPECAWEAHARRINSRRECGDKGNDDTDLKQINVHDKSEGSSFVCPAGR